MSNQHTAERKKIKAAFELFDRDNKEVCSRDDIGTIMRYLGAFPTEEELVTEILPQLCADGDSLNIKYRTFEPFMLQTLLEQHYEPDTEETLLQAFRTLDPDGRGYLDEATMMELLTEGEFGFKEKEIEDFMRVAKDPETGLIHFEDYIALLTN